MLQQGKDGVRADIAGAAGDEDHGVSLCWDVWMGVLSPQSA